MNVLLATLQWYADMGVDEAIAEAPWDRAAAAVPQPSLAAATAIAARPKAPAMNAPPPLAVPPPQAAANTGMLASELASIGDLGALRERLETFDGCALKTTATNTVFGVGPETADLMIIGEAPGEQEDRQGQPFVGPSGHLLDRMLASIGLEREAVYVTNTLYWRPPGNRTPTPQEVQACLPFLRRQIQLIRPKALLLVGGAAAKTMLQRQEGIMRLRGRWHEYVSEDSGDPIPAMATFHPAYLLRSPAQKREAWRDLLALQKRLSAGNG